MGSSASLARAASALSAGSAGRALASLERLGAASVTLGPGLERHDRVREVLAAVGLNRLRSAARQRSAHEYRQDPAGHEAANDRKTAGRAHRASPAPAFASGVRSTTRRRTSAATADSPRSSDRLVV